MLHFPPTPTPTPTHSSLPSPSQLFQHHVGEISYKVLRNSDFREVNVEVGGSTVLRFAAAYGFRNIQVGLTQWTLAEPGAGLTNGCVLEGMTVHMVVFGVL